MLSLLRFMIFAEMILLCVFCTRSPVSAQQRNVSEFFHAKDQVDYVEVYHIAHVDVSYRTDILLGDLIAEGPSAQDYVRITARNFRAINELYKVLKNTTVDPKTACASGSQLDVRWGIVINYRDHTREAVGFGNLFDCVQILSIDAPLHSSWDLLKYVERTFPFMK